MVRIINPFYCIESRYLVELVQTGVIRTYSVDYHLQVQLWWLDASTRLDLGIKVVISG